MSNVPKFIFWNEVNQYQTRIEKIVNNFNSTSESKVILISTSDEKYKKYDYTDLYKLILDIGPDAIIRREEHGCFFFQRKPWQSLVEQCENKKIKYITFDFGYFDHYRTYMADLCDKNNKSTIHRLWETLSNVVDWTTVPDIVQNYRNNLLKKYEIARNSKPLNDLPQNKYVVIWPQQDSIFLRPEFLFKNSEKTGMTDWIIKICEEVKKIGLIPVVKLTYLMLPRKQFNIEKIKEHAQVYGDLEKINLYNGLNLNYSNNVNTYLIAHSAFNIIGSSSVSNEIILAEKPLIATGKSWFNGLNIFNEPTNWDNLLNNCTAVYQDNRNKWVNWWLSRQCKSELLHNKIIETYHFFK